MALFCAAKSTTALGSLCCLLLLLIGGAHAAANNHHHPSSDVHFELTSGALLDVQPARVARDMSPQVCLSTCRYDAKCRSVNIDYRKGTCEFLHETALSVSLAPQGQGGQDGSSLYGERRLKSSPHYNHFEKVRLRIPTIDPSTSNNSNTAASLVAANGVYRPAITPSVLRTPAQCLERDWAFERIRGRELAGIPHEKVLVDASTREECESACLEFTEFNCRSAEFNYENRMCRLSPFNRFSALDKKVSLEQSRSHVDYLENNCAYGKWLD